MRSPLHATPAALHDRREGGEWTRGQSLKNLILYVAVSGTLFVLRPLSPGALRALGQALGRLLHALGLARRLTLDNLALAYPDLPLEDRSALARRVYVALGGYLGEAVGQLRGARGARSALGFLPFEEGSREVLEAAMREGRGVVFASAHLGPWERVAGSLVHHGFPLVTVARESYDPRFAPLYEALRGGAGVGAIYRGEATAPLQIVRTLRRGGLLGVPMDLASRVPSVDVPFLGIPARTPVGPARIALRTGAVVVVGTAAKAPDGALVLRVIPVATDDLAPDAAGELALTARINEELSRRIRAFPEGWVWMHPRWAEGAISTPIPKESDTLPPTWYARG